LTTSAGTFTRYQGIVTAFLNFLGPRRNLSLASLRSEDIQRYRDDLADKVSTGTVNTHLKVLRVALGKAWKAKHLDSNPAKYVDNLTRTDKHERRAFTRGELRKLLENASDEWRTMILVGLPPGRSRHPDVGEYRLAAGGNHCNNPKNRPNTDSTDCQTIVETFGRSPHK
jgi:integrase